MDCFIDQAEHGVAHPPCLSVVSTMIDAAGD